VIKLFGIGRYLRRWLCPADLQCLRGPERRPFGFCNDPDKAPLTDDSDEAGNILHCVFVDIRWFGSDCERANHTPMQHPWNAHVMNIDCLTGHLRRQIKARYGFADGGVFLWVLGLYILGQLESTGFSFGLDGDVETFAAD